MHKFSQSPGRREFLKYMLTLPLLAGGEPVEAAPPVHSFFWVDLGSGRLGSRPSIVPAGMPGSIMKLVAASALLEVAHWPADRVIECTGSAVVHAHRHVCLHAHGRVSLVQAIALSCNVFMASATAGLNPAAIIEYARGFALDFPCAGHPPGRFPRHPGSDPAMYTLGLSPDLEPNALQLLRLAALVATRGHLKDFYARPAPPPAGRGLVMSLAPGTWEILQSGMRLAGRIGTASQLDPDDRLHLAVKTGTAPHGNAYQSWVVGYFPYDKPRYAWCLHARAGTSLDEAVPAARQMLLQTFT
jgi:cell division protein FtsI/penicillin-binding protein 2